MKAARVLPEPVGAAISTCWPDLIAGQASACAGVGALKALSNHAATAGWNSDVVVFSFMLDGFGGWKLRERTAPSREPKTPLCVFTIWVRKAGESTLSSLNPPPCPSPTRGEGTLWHTPSPSQTLRTKGFVRLASHHAADVIEHGALLRFPPPL